MASQPFGPADALIGRLSELLAPIGPMRPLGANAYAVQAAGRMLVAKSGPPCLDEADGLRQLGAVNGAPPVPEVVLVDSDLLVTTYVDQVARSPDHDASLGRSLAMLHRAPCPCWGGGSSWIGACPIDPSPRSDGAGFYGARLSQLASRCGLSGAVEPVVSRLDELLPPDGPALVHGDLWWGNVLFGRDSTAWVIDPSVHGGHPEEDLAMLALFGAVPDRLLAAYAEIRRLSPDWQERLALFQLYPLLVHTVLFGGSYRGQAVAAARRYA